MIELCRQIKSDSVAIIGMCKNAGKTTVLNELISGMPDITLGLTSIGRDGESTDVATITPKPDVYVREGTVFATASKMLAYCDTTLEILDTSGISTALGEVIYAKAKSDGNIQIAGASTVDGLCKIHSQMKSFGIDKAIFDGAVSRKSLSVPSLCDELILCSGASYSPSLSKTVCDTAYIAKLFCLDVCPRPQNINNITDKFVVVSEECISFSELWEFFEYLKRNKSNISSVYIKGAVTDTILKSIFESGIRNSLIIADDPCKILASYEMFTKCCIRDIKFNVLEKARLCAITVNPYSAYGYSYEGQMLFDEVCKRVEGYNIPVFDVKGGLYFEN